MNLDKPMDGDLTRNAIELFLNDLGRAKGPSSSPVRCLEGRDPSDNEIRAVGYILSDNAVFREEERSLIVLPRSPSVTPADGCALLSKHSITSRCRRVIFIDVYSTGCQLQEDETFCISPEELWNHFFGGRLCPLSSEAMRLSRTLARRVDDGYQPRRFLQFHQSGLSGSTEATADALVAMDGWAEDILHTWSVARRRFSPSNLRDRLLVFGEAGLGKTWLLLKFALEQKKASDNGNPWVHPAAIYIDLSEARGELLTGTGLDGLLSKHILLNGYLPHPKGGIATVEALISSGLVILLLDEFDTLTRQFNEAIVEYHYRLILQNLPSRARVVVATRGTRFTSRARMIATFALSDPYCCGTARHLSAEHEAKGAAPFTVMTLAQFSDFESFVSESAETAGLSKSRDSVSNLVLSKSLSEIGRIPRCLAAIRTLLPLLEAGEANKLDEMRIFELAVLWQLRFNLTTGRAIYRLHYEECGEYQSQILDLHARLKILERIAWFLVEFDREAIDTDEMKHAILDYAPVYVEEAINDLKCQTVFDFKDGKSSDLRFREDVLRAFFASRGICSLLWKDEERSEGSEDEQKIGIRSLGLYEISRIERGYGFLRTFFTVGFLRVPTDPIDGPMEAPEQRGYWKDRIRRPESRKVFDLAKDLVVSERSFSNTTRYLQANLDACGLKDAELTEHDEWSRSLENEEDRASRERISKLSSLGILIHGNENDTGRSKEIQPVVVAKTEIVNRAFLEFLGHPDFTLNKPARDPQLICLEEDSEALHRRWSLTDPNMWRKVRIADRRGDVHPLAWEVIHKTKDRCVVEHDQWLRRLTNDYHLFDWKNGIVPPEAYEKPVVWISFYVAAVYCNWKSDQEGLDPAYTILVRAGQVPASESESNTATSEVLVSLDSLANGYRLPFSCEWAFAARAGRSVDSFPWDGEREHVKRRLKDALITPQQDVLPVTRSFCNDFGVSGMIGNVREWVEDERHYQKYCDARAHAVKSITENTPRGSDNLRLGKSSRIMGSTGALGSETFRYSHVCLRTGVALPRFNTNPDVGFRWARSPLPRDMDFVNREENRKRGLRGNRG